MTEAELRQALSDTMDLLDEATAGWKRANETSRRAVETLEKTVKENAKLRARIRELERGNEASDTGSGDNRTDYDTDSWVQSGDSGAC